MEEGAGDHTMVSGTSKAMMCAITQTRFGSADVLQTELIDIPTIGPGEVLVEVHAAAVDRGVWHGMTGLPYLGRLAFGIRTPRFTVPGFDVSGVVVEAGDKYRDRINAASQTPGRGSWRNQSTAGHPGTET